MSNYATLVDILIRDEMKGITNHERILELGDTPEILQNECGFPDITLAIKANVVSKACFDHGIGTSVIKRLPEILSSPKSVFRSANPKQTDSVVVVTFEVKGEAPIIVPVRKDQQAGRKRFNFVTSMYAKEGPPPEIKWKKKGLLIWEGK
ncbi:hypothetical protein ACPV54_26040 [Vibrio mediterranei]